MKLFQLHGLKCSTASTGCFAFAIWDKLEKKANSCSG
jgi:hypothetical protein